MTNEERQLMCRLHALVQLCNGVTVKAASGHWVEANRLLQGEVMPAVQTLTQDAWLMSRPSGSGQA